MSVEEIKASLATLPRAEQDQVIAYLFHLRNSDDRDYQAQLDRRSVDTDRSHWLTPDEFEQELDKRDEE